MYTIAYFSPTGNTKFLARHLKEQIIKHETSLIDITRCDPLQLEKSDKLIIMFAIHAFNAPPEVVDFVKRLPESQFNTISLIAVGCNDIWVNDAVSLSAKKVLNEKGYVVELDRVIAMPLTFIVDFPKETKEALIEDAKLRIQQVAKDLENGVRDEKNISCKSKTLTKVASAEKYAAKLFGLELYANDNCISCGKCWTGCPSENIRENSNGKPKFGFKCSMCMKCIYTCPTNAINPRFSKFIPIKGGYKLQD